MRRAAAVLGLAAVCLCVAALGVWMMRPIVPDRTAIAPQELAAGPPLQNAETLDRFVRQDAQGIDAVVVLDGQGVRYAFGPVDRPMNTGSARKSILSLLVGIAEAQGMLDLDQSLDALGLADGATPLTEGERQATLRDLIMSRSGIYVPAGGETALARSTRPARGSARPSAQFYYNNWDFNLLGIAFEQETGMRIGDALQAWLAGPLGLQDFHPDHVYFDDHGGGDDMPTYRMFLSPRDMARIGLMVARDGQWQGQQVIPADWLALSLQPWSEVGPPLSGPPIEGFGYSWWINTETGDALAAGWGGQYLYVDRAAGRAITLRRDTGQSLAGHLWFRQFGRPGRAEDLLRVLALVADG